MILASAAAQPLGWALGRVILFCDPRGVRNAMRPSAKKHYYTTPYFNPDAMVHVLLTLNEPLLQRSRPRGPLGLSLTTIKSGDWT